MKSYTLLNWDGSALGSTSTPAASLPQPTSSATTNQTASIVNGTGNIGQQAVHLTQNTSMDMVLDAAGANNDVAHPLASTSSITIDFVPPMSKWKGDEEDDEGSDMDMSLSSDTDMDTPVNSSVIEKGERGLANDASVTQNSVHNVSLSSADLLREATTTPSMSSLATSGPTPSLLKGLTPDMTATSTLPPSIPTPSKSQPQPTSTQSSLLTTQARRRLPSNPPPPALSPHSQPQFSTPTSTVKSTANTVQNTLSNPRFFPSMDSPLHAKSIGASSQTASDVLPSLVAGSGCMSSQPPSAPASSSPTVAFVQPPRSAVSEAVVTPVRPKSSSSLMTYSRKRTRDDLEELPVVLKEKSPAKGQGANDVISLHDSSSEDERGIDGDEVMSMLTGQPRAKVTKTTQSTPKHQSSAGNKTGYGVNFITTPKSKSKSTSTPTSLPGPSKPKPTSAQGTVTPRSNPPSTPRGSGSSATRAKPVSVPTPASQQAANSRPRGTPPKTTSIPSPVSSPLFTPKSSPKHHPGEYDVDKLFTPEASPVPKRKEIQSHDRKRNEASSVVVLRPRPSSSSAPVVLELSDSDLTSIGSSSPPPKKKKLGDDKTTKLTTTTTVKTNNAHVVSSNASRSKPLSMKTGPSTTQLPALASNSTYCVSSTSSTTPNAPRKRQRIMNRAYVDVPPLKKHKSLYVRFDREAKLVAKMKSLGFALETKRFMEETAMYDASGGRGRSVVRDYSRAILGGEGKKRKRGEDVWWDDSDVRKMREGSVVKSPVARKRMQSERPESDGEWRESSEVPSSMRKQKSKAKARDVAKEKPQSRKEKSSRGAGGGDVIDLTMDDRDVNMSVGGAGAATKKASVLKDSDKGNETPRRAQSLVPAATKPASVASVSISMQKSRVAVELVEGPSKQKKKEQGVSGSMAPPPVPPKAKPKPRPTAPSSSSQVVRSSMPPPPSPSPSLSKPKPKPRPILPASSSSPAVKTVQKPISVAGRLEGTSAPVSSSASTSRSKSTKPTDRSVEETDSEQQLRWLSPLIPMSGLSTSSLSAPTPASTKISRNSASETPKQPTPAPISRKGKPSSSSHTPPDVSNHRPPTPVREIESSSLFSSPASSTRASPPASSLLFSTHEFPQDMTINPAVLVHGTGDQETDILGESELESEEEEDEEGEQAVPIVGHQIRHTASCSLQTRMNLFLGGFLGIEDVKGKGKWKEDSKPNHMDRSRDRLQWKNKGYVYSTLTTARNLGDEEDDEGFLSLGVTVPLEDEIVVKDIWDEEPVLVQKARSIPSSSSKSKKTNQISKAHPHSQPPALKPAKAPASARPPAKQYRSQSAINASSSTHMPPNADKTNRGHVAGTVDPSIFSSESSSNDRESTADFSHSSSFQSGQNHPSEKALGKRKADSTAPLDNIQSVFSSAALGQMPDISFFKYASLPEIQATLLDLALKAGASLASSQAPVTSPMKDKQLDIFIHQYTDMSPEKPFERESGGGFVDEDGGFADGGDMFMSKDSLGVAPASMSGSEHSSSSNSVLGSGTVTTTRNEYALDTLPGVSHDLFSDSVGGVGTGTVFGGDSLLDLQSELEMSEAWQPYEIDPVERSEDWTHGSNVVAGLAETRFTTIDPTLLGGASAQEVLEAGLEADTRRKEWELASEAEKSVDGESEEEADDEGNDDLELHSDSTSGSQEDSEDEEAAADLGGEEKQQATQTEEREQDLSHTILSSIEVTRLPSPTPSVYFSPRPSSSSSEYIDHDQRQRKSTRERKDSMRKREANAAVSSSSKPTSTRALGAVAISEQELDADSKLAYYEDLMHDTEKRNNQNEKRVYCHQCRRPKTIVMIQCEQCPKLYCIRCLAFRYLALDFDLPSVKRQEEYVSGIIDAVPLIFDDDTNSITSSSLPLLPPITTSSISSSPNAVPPSEVEFWGAIYNLDGEKIGSAVVAQKDAARGTIPVVYAHALPGTTFREPLAKRRRVEAHLPCPKQTRIFVGVAQRCWGLGRNPKTKVLDKISRVKRGVHAELDDLSELSSLSSSDEDEGEVDELQDVVTLPEDPTPSITFSSNGLGDDAVARAISMALEACGQSTNFDDSNNLFLV
ncbi:hypothetical protein CVT24_007808 [Panaeolus cyanescens]|uniref:Uncharacterized protein n=1 Tax=Panaeolus cyanescens TaxID=181874 RepID=A0A409W4T3_9AGAR|nr:hypothetical protein CVT24_007808 [Panaeolus cyanescens]